MPNGYQLTQLSKLCRGDQKKIWNRFVLQSKYSFAEVPERSHDKMGFTFAITMKIYP